MSYDAWKTRSPDDEEFRGLPYEPEPPELVEMVSCEQCCGDGITRHAIWVYEHGCGFPHEDVEERPCDACNGAGFFVCEVQPDAVSSNQRVKK